MRNNLIDRLVYQAYIFCLPFDRFLNIEMGETTEKMFKQFSTIIMVFGVSVLFMSGRFSLSGKYTIITKQYLFMAIYSIFASLILMCVLPSNLPSPLGRCVGDIVLYFFVLLSVYYNSYCLTNIISFRQLRPLFEVQICILLIIGYLQLGAILGIGFCANFHTFLTKIFHLNSIHDILLVNRGVFLFGSEPASVSIVCLFLVPFLFTILSDSHGFTRIKYLIIALLFVILLALSNSSSVLILLLAAIILFILLKIGRNIGKFIIGISFLLGATFAGLTTIDTGINPELENKESLEYVIVGKAIDRENMSTAMRMSTVINDVKVFLSHPITGVGDGNQGYFYRDNIPNWVKNSNEVQDLLYNNIIPNGGGNFFASYFSAYGIIGLLFLGIFIKRYNMLYKESILSDDPQLQNLFIIGIVLFLFSGWFVNGIKQNETIIFLISLPFVSYDDEFEEPMAEEF